MKSHLLFASLALLASCQSTASETPEAKPQDGSQAVEAAAPSPEEVMAMMAEMGTPGPNHTAMEEMVGTFDAQSKMWMAPGAPPSEMEGTMVNHWVMGGRYLRGDYTGEMMGQEFQGVSLTGYDNAQECYNGIWYDSMSTGMQNVSVGTREGKVFTFDKETFDPMMRVPSREKMVITIENKDRHTMEMYMVMPDGSEMKSMEIVYTRKS